MISLSPLRPRQWGMYLSHPAGTQDHGKLWMLPPNCGSVDRDELVGQNGSHIGPECFGIWKFYFMVSSQVFRYLINPVKFMVFFPPLALFQFPFSAQSFHCSYLLKRRPPPAARVTEEKTITTGKKTGLLYHPKCFKESRALLMSWAKALEGTLEDLPQRIKWKRAKNEEAKAKANLKETRTKHLLEYWKNIFIGHGPWQQIAVW